MAKMILGLLSSLVVGLVFGLWAGSSPLFAFRTFEERATQEAIYQGQPTSYWIRQLHDRSPAFRQQAVQALEQIGPKEEAVVPALAGVLKDANAGVRMGAAFALRRLSPGAISAVPQLIAALQDENQYVRLDAVCALASISPHDEAVLEALNTALHDKSPIVRRATLNTLGAIGPPAKIALPAVREAVNGSDADVCQDAAAAVGNTEKGSN